MARRKDDLFAVGSEKRAGGAAAAGADHSRRPSRKRLSVNLMERIVAANRLEDDRSSIWREVCLARSAKSRSVWHQVECKLPDVLQMPRFVCLSRIVRRLGHPCNRCRYRK